MASTSGRPGWRSTLMLVSTVFAVGVTLGLGFTIGVTLGLVVVGR